MVLSSGQLGEPTQCDGVSVLNPGLYSSLVSAFRSVRISGQGVQASVSRSGNTVHVTGGEYYCVNCPMCGDRRYRLWVNYRWGTYEAGKRLTHVFTCFNNQCERRGLDLELYLQGYLSRYATISPLVDPTHVPQRRVGMMYPGKCEALQSLPLSHPACKFFLRRNFDPVTVGHTYGVSVCTAPSVRIGTDLQDKLRGRIIFPITYDRQLVGWQARYVDSDGNGVPPHGCEKYLTMPGFKKSLFLYNYDTAATERKQSGIVVEGVMDAMRVPGALACFGHTLSETQRDILQRIYGSGSLVILFDRDAVEEAKEIQRKMYTSFRYGVACIILPDSRDPADWEFNPLMELISDQAAAQGVSLAFAI